MYRFGPVRGCHRMGPQCLLTPPVSASSIYAAVVYVSVGEGQFVISGVLLLSYPVSYVNLSMLSLILSFFLSLGGPEPEDHASGLPDMMTPCCPQSTWPCCCSSFNCSSCNYRILTCSPERTTCPRPAVFNSLETAGVVELLLMIGYEKPTDIYS